MPTDGPIHCQTMGNFDGAWEPNPYLRWDLCPGYDVERYGQCGKQKRESADLCYVCSARKRAIEREQAAQEKRQDTQAERHLAMQVAIELGIDIPTLMALAQTGGPPMAHEIVQATREFGPADQKGGRNDLE